MSIRPESPPSLREKETAAGDEWSVSPGPLLCEETPSLSGEDSAPGSPLTAAVSGTPPHTPTESLGGLNTAGGDTPSPDADGAHPGWQGAVPLDDDGEEEEGELLGWSGNAGEDRCDSQAPAAMLGRGAPQCPRNEDVTGEGWRSHRKHVFVLSEAGKPIYSRYGNEEALSSTMGVMMALVSFVQDGGDNIRSIQADDYKVVFSRHGPLVLVSVSRGRQSPQQLRRELVYVYQQIVSLLTRATVARIFQRKQNYDLRRLLAGSERLLDNLLGRLESDPGLLLGAVQCQALAPGLREAVTQLLLRCVTANLVFSILLARGRLVSIAQERALVEEARLEPADLHLLFNLLGGSGAPPQAGEVWTPVCLPGLCPDGYFYAYASSLEAAGTGLRLLLLSTDRGAFHSVAACKTRIEEGLKAQGLLAGLQAALRTPSNTGSSRLSLPDLRHFLYRPLDVAGNPRHLAQYASPEIEAPYATVEDKERLFDLYQELYGKVHSCTRPLRLIYHVAERETLLAWVTGRFELYTCLSPLVTKSAAICLVTQLLRWVRKVESQLFIYSPAKYCTTPSPRRGSRGGGTDTTQPAPNGLPSPL
ncbi:vacuolar fusion protein MON1 homolog B-like isoform X2 [Hemiscyllium ocellatum]|uniref:vacuolar fusion protein MON1 homolog B-like isoform X2 n=1 Tax=Hemiscyllium ocellatum TaxID=170820 RepID=UPI002965F9CD|nr:vacuolar fusion protein MON1 homolog B-like isoform X2 [Hemiscyllium ocellatum]